MPGTCRRHGRLPDQGRHSLGAVREKMDRDAKERYRYFLDHFSGLERMLTDVQAADFLRIEKKYYYRIKKRAGQHFEEK